MEMMGLGVRTERHVPGAPGLWSVEKVRKLGPESGKGELKDSEVLQQAKMEELGQALYPCREGILHECRGYRMARAQHAPTVQNINLNLKIGGLGTTIRKSKQFLDINF